MADWKEKARFTERDKDDVEKLLSRIVNLVPINWHWDEDDCLVVNGFHEDTVTFSNWRSAKAGLEMFICGYERGDADGRNDRQH